MYYESSREREDETNKFRRGLYVELNVAIRHSVVGRTRERWVGNRERVNRGNELPES